ncbi:MAG: type III-B CRISPR module-associated protein Cmr3 [Candidatus Riflebacteria bacterium]|nr:type III-B CRISPR module-associated protein Cmr3 [Candidatus Riflebacteria bacterium]
MTTELFIKPCDIFMPRGNSHFGVNSGDFGQIRILPAPSIFAGAIRSFIASTNIEDLKQIEKGERPVTEKIAGCLGSLKESKKFPGTFRIGQVCLCRKTKDGSYEPIYRMPSDIVVFEEDHKIASIKHLLPSEPISGIKGSSELPKTAILQAANMKPAGGYWLIKDGFQKYLNGGLPDKGDCIKESDLWKKQMRTGVALNGQTRSAEEGMLYTTECLSFCDGVGFAVEVIGADELLPETGLLSLGGEARGAVFEKIKDFSEPSADFSKIAEQKRFKLLLTAPAIFPDGWLPDEQLFPAKLVCASVKGYETLSGWNMVENRPKDAVRTVPAGSVYWFEDFEGTASDLQEGLQNYFIPEDKQRYVEGFNKAVIAAW